MAFWLALALGVGLWLIVLLFGVAMCKTAARADAQIDRWHDDA